jgi:hypothetical protein
MTKTEKRDLAMNPQTLVLALGLLANGGGSYYSKTPADTIKVVEDNKDRSKKNEIEIQYNKDALKEIKSDLKEIKNLLRNRKNK